MQRVLVVGSGSAGVHFALTALRKGHQVVMLDVGHEKAGPDAVHHGFLDLKANLEDPVRYFLGERFESVVYPSAMDDYYTRYYGFPPTKSYVFSPEHAFCVQATGFQPIVSFARGGLAEAWTGGAYPFNDHELREFPFDYAEIEPYYSEVAARIGVSGASDDLARFYPVHPHLLSPLRLDEQSDQLLASYTRQKTYVNSRLNCYMGHSRVATLSTAQDGRGACSYCGRCLWGCPSESLYTPAITLRECQRYSNFEYVTNAYVERFTYAANGRVTGMRVLRNHADQSVAITADKYVLAAGTLSSSKIFMESVFHQTGTTVRLPGLMDNRQVLIPFINLKFLGRAYNPNNYQYQQLAIGITSEDQAEYIHGQITTLKTALTHPIIPKMPVDLQSAVQLFRSLRAGLGMVNVSFHDRRRTANWLTLGTEVSPGLRPLVIHYEPRSDERLRVDATVRVVKKLLWKLGCVVPPGMVHVRPMGASVHYVGTIPMSRTRQPYALSPVCRSYDFENLYLVDGVAFPFLPAKNSTFTLMANAVRVADAVL
jgi:choline dehydrogenase-like flavoprotein